MALAMRDERFSHLWPRRANICARVETPKASAVWASGGGDGSPHVRGKGFWQGCFWPHEDVPPRPRIASQAVPSPCEQPSPTTPPDFSSPPPSVQIHVGLERYTITLVWGANACKRAEMLVERRLQPAPLLPSHRLALHDDIHDTCYAPSDRVMLLVHWLWRRKKPQYKPGRYFTLRTAHFDANPPDPVLSLCFPLDQDSGIAQTR